MTQTEKPHHHGDLREALVSAGIELMEQNGIDALTLRKCAARAGVSHSAPAHHFNGLASLKLAIIARGHKIFAKTMVEEMQQSGPDPMARLQAVCQGYLIFANRHNALFQLMFKTFNMNLAGITGSVLTEFEQNAALSYALLEQACEPFENVKGTGNSTEVTVWALVHGYAVLFDKDSNRNIPTGEVPDFSLILGGLGLHIRQEATP